MRDIQSLSHPIQFPILTRFAGTQNSQHLMESGWILFITKQSLQANRVRKHMEKEMQTYQSPHFTQYVFLFVYVHSTFFQKELNESLTFLIYTKQAILSSLHKSLQIFTLFPTQRQKCNKIYILEKFNILGRKHFVF